MGNSLGFIMNHARRLKNRYNAQYRAIEFISKGNRRSAPRHPNASAKETVEDPSAFQELQKKDLNLDIYLKEVYIHSRDEILQDSPQSGNNPERPLPESREPRPNATFIEPEEIEKGWCTITQISDFLASHEEDPLENNVATIAEKYSLEKEKVGNILKYFSVFRVYDKARNALPRDYESEDKTAFAAVEEMKTDLKQLIKHNKSRSEGLSDSGRKQEASPGEFGEGCQSVEKAVKN